MTVNPRHQLTHIQPAAAGHAQGLQRGHRDGRAHQQGQINAGNVLQQSRQRQDAQMLLQLHAVKSFLQSLSGSRHLAGRQAHPFGRAGTA